GVRRALGAQDGDIARLVVGQALALVAVGIAAGLGAGPWRGRLLASFLFRAVQGRPNRLGGGALGAVGGGGAGRAAAARRGGGGRVAAHAARRPHQRRLGAPLRVSASPEQSSVCSCRPPDTADRDLFTRLQLPTAQASA